MTFFTSPDAGNTPSNGERLLFVELTDETTRRCSAVHGHDHPVVKLERQSGRPFEELNLHLIDVLVDHLHIFRWLRRTRRILSKTDGRKTKLYIGIGWQCNELSDVLDVHIRQKLIDARVCLLALK